jgi:hypothetical protein
MSDIDHVKNLFRKWVSPLGLNEMKIVYAGEVYKVYEQEGKISARHKKTRQSAPVS